MNERIKQLALEAFQPINDIASEGIADRHTFDQAWFQMYNEKFAELIVRELSAVANHFSDGHEVRQFDDSKRYLYFVDIGQAIEEHFGVEE